MWPTMVPVTQRPWLWPRLPGSILLWSCCSESYCLLVIAFSSLTLFPSLRLPSLSPLCFFYSRGRAWACSLFLASDLILVNLLLSQLTLCD